MARQERRVDWPLVLGPGAPRPASSAVRPTSGIGSVLSVVDELGAYRDADTLLRRMVELGRDRLGFERLAIFLEDAARGVMRGTWGTGARGETTDEHHLVFELRDAERQISQQLRSGASRWAVITDCPLMAQLDDETLLLGYGWVAVTPLSRRHGPLGLVYNDAALTRSPLDEAQQVRLSVFCSMVGQLLDLHEAASASKQRVFHGWSPTSHPAVGRILALLGEDPTLDGQALGAAVGLSSSRLLRIFKAEVGVSLVEYRNRLRLERFFAAVDHAGGNLLEAALAAGFGSYSQFHRVFRELIGTTPREYLLGPKAT